MALVNLIKIIQDARTIAQAFDKLKGMEIMVEPELGSSYIPLDVREEFVILEDNGGDRRQFLHPYGTSLSYYVYNANPRNKK